MHYSIINPKYSTDVSKHELSILEDSTLRWQNSQNDLLNETKSYRSFQCIIAIHPDIP